MARKMDYGNWAQVVGKYDLSTRKGEIVSMLPATVAFASIDGGEERVRLKGFDEEHTALFDLAVNPMTASCGKSGTDHMFEEFVPVTPSLKDVKLFIDGAEVSSYVPGAAEPRGHLKLASALVERPNRIPLTGNVSAEANVSYTVQVRPHGDTRWHTMATGLAQPDMVDVDINQFPGASAIEVRVLRTNGLETVRVFEEQRQF